MTEIFELQNTINFLQSVIDTETLSENPDYSAIALAKFEMLMATQLLQLLSKHYQEI